MSMLTHSCTNPKCLKETFDNTWRRTCPECGERCTTVSDEDFDPDPLLDDPFDPSPDNGGNL